VFRRVLYALLLISVKYYRTASSVAKFLVWPHIKGACFHTLWSLSPLYLHTLLCQSPHTFIHYCAYRPIPSYTIVSVAPYLHTLLCLSPHTFIHYCVYRPIPLYTIVSIVPYLHTLLYPSPHTFIHYCIYRPIPSYTIVSIAPYLYTLLYLTPHNTFVHCCAFPLLPPFPPVPNNTKCEHR
jgi:hypothetical protein